MIWASFIVELRGGSRSPLLSIEGICLLPLALRTQNAKTHCFNTYAPLGLALFFYCQTQTMECYGESVHFQKVR